MHKTNVSADCVFPAFPNQVQMFGFTKDNLICVDVFYLIGVQVKCDYLSDYHSMK